MRAFAVTEQKTLKTVYVGLHESEGDAWQIFLGWPDEAEIRAAKMRFVCQEVHLYPTAQQCRL